MTEKIGGMTFDGDLLVSGFDGEVEIAKRGGLDAMFKKTVEGNALLSRLVYAKIHAPVGDEVIPRGIAPGDAWGGPTED